MIIRDLPELLKSGEDADAFQAFADYFGPKFRAWFRTTRLGPSAAAEDLAADCVEDIALKIHMYEPREGKTFESWVYAIARRKLATRLAKTAADENLIENLRHTLEQRDGSDPRPGLVEAVREAVAKLPDLSRQIVQLRDLEKMSYQDIGLILGIKTGTARGRHKRALTQLRPILSDDPRVLPTIERCKDQSLGVNA
jgi:RNA polymerase sigma factor (sigma-70 family)